MYPVLLEIGPLKIYSFGAMMALAFLTASYLTGRELNRRGYDGEIASTMVLWAAAGGLLGARLLAVANDWEGFVLNPLSSLFTGAGFAWYGGLIGGTLAVSWSIHRNRLPWLTAVDCIAPALVLAQAIGRIGCELAGDGDWGRPSTLPWAHSYPDAIIGWERWAQASGYPIDVRVHPTPIYEVIAYTAVFAVLWSLRKKPLAPGGLFWLYLVLAPALRFLVEFVRINPAVFWGLSQAQVLSLLMIAIGAWKLATSARPAAAVKGSPAARATRT